jgi:putative heme-binding domain-containing protein
VDAVVAAAAPGLVVVEARRRKTDQGPVMQNAKVKMQKGLVDNRAVSVPVALCLFAFCILNFAFPAVVSAQHETAFDVEEGGRAYRNSCANCHGPDGNEIPGIDLGRGQFRRPMTDADLVRIIRTGIPNTPMPATNMTEEQAARIVAYLRSTAASKRTASVSGDAVRGKSLYEGKGNCASCHRVNGVGSRLGPDLSRIGQLRRAAELETSLVDPGAEVLPTNRFYRVVTKNGTTVTGRLLNHDTFTVQMMDSKEELRTFRKDDLKEQAFAPTPMPSYENQLAPQELADVVTYLVTLKGR